MAKKEANFDLYIHDLLVEAGTLELCQYLGHKKLNFSPSIAYAERIISYAARASSSTCCSVL